MPKKQKVGHIAHTHTQTHNLKNRQSQVTKENGQHQCEKHIMYITIFSLITVTHDTRLDIVDLLPPIIR